ncbi:MAG: gliding motility-associated C-terminal domain-containing protein [Saprospiraceae bacterium]|nr:gliding motility-associated C-terminal domain-containing protein [Saprospiraceae bacterium]
MHHLKFSLLLLFFSPFLIAQVPYDDCDNARLISNPESYCSGKTEFSLNGATDSGYGPSSCWTGPAADIWFEFKAIATGVNIVVNGRNIGSTLRNPQATLYYGVCGGTIQELDCNADVTNLGVIALFENGLIIGATYYIRVSGINGPSGNFQLCVTNFNPPVIPGQDCPTAAILCDKSAFVVQTLSGSGSQPNEGKGTCLEPFPGSQSEDQSTWLKWTAANNGTLTFDITPLKDGDDIDFALYELSGGIDDCNNRKALRCNATACDGSTGLNLTSTDLEEDFNCDKGEDRYVKFIDMEAGKSYGLLINNFDNSGIGFRISWGGTGEFLGPEPDFIIDPVSGLRCDQDFSVTDASTFSNGTITDYEWHFGLRAIPASSDVKGSHQVKYSSFGEKYISLTVTSNRGCKVTKVKSLNAEPCCEDLEDISISPKVTFPDCNGDAAGQIDVAGLGGNPEYFFKLNNGKFTPRTRFDKLPAGSYEIVIVDTKGCTDSIVVDVEEPDPIVVDAGPDVELELGDSTLLNGSYFLEETGDSIWWSPPNGLRTPLDLETNATAPGTTTYTLHIKSEKGCEASDSLTIRVITNRTIYAPNIILANGQGGPNNFFNLVGRKAVKSIDVLEVYDRWGNKLYQGEDIDPFDQTSGWDGTFNGSAVNPGVYTWIARVRYVDEVVEVKSGDITVVH